MNGPVHMPRYIYEDDLFSPPLCLLLLYFFPPIIFCLSRSDSRGSVALEHYRLSVPYVSIAYIEFMLTWERCLFHAVRGYYSIILLLTTGRTIFYILLHFIIFYYILSCSTWHLIFPYQPGSPTWQLRHQLRLEVPRHAKNPQTVASSVGVEIPFTVLCDMCDMGCKPLIVIADIRNALVEKGALDEK
ncbi:hypothetical protein I7I48_02792 [Histoplasma ohiense]|nr:hypothetical protein I7I48_02792 [Histoplasma ohiense (nom. inval.)]